MRHRSRERPYYNIGPAREQPILIGDATRLRTATGWQPEIPFDQTLDDLLAYWRSRPVG